MKNDDSTAERAGALLHEAIDLLQRAENAPYSPVDKPVPGKMRRHFRRGAERLRRGETQQKYKNLFTAEQLTDLSVITIRRDAIHYPHITHSPPLPPHS